MARLSPPAGPTTRCDEKLAAARETAQSVNRGGESPSDGSKVVCGRTGHRRHAAQSHGTTCRPSRLEVSAGCWTESEIVEQHVAGAAAKNDPERYPQDEIIHLHQRDRRRAAPQIFVLDQRPRVEPAEHDAADIGQRIPADRDRSDRNGDRIEYRKRDGEKGHLAHSALV